MIHAVDTAHLAPIERLRPEALLQPNALLRVAINKFESTRYTNHAAKRVQDVCFGPIADVR